MQKSFLPAKLPELSGWEMRTFFQPAKQVAGDFYDVFELPENHLGIVVADVCDKGVGAALFMALFRSLIRIYSGGYESEWPLLLAGVPHPDKPTLPDELLGISNSPHLGPLNAVSATNNYIANNHGDVSMFATMFFGILNATNGLLSYINGGHEPIIVSGPQGGAKNTLDPTGPAVGMLPDIDFNIEQIVIEAGDTLFAFTDGVSEAQSVDNELFTKDRLLSLFIEPFSSIDELMRRIEGQLINHIGNIEQSDDITFMSLRRLIR
jgi:two-component system response regulator